MCGCVRAGGSPPPPPPPFCEETFSYTILSLSGEYTLLLAFAFSRPIFWLRRALWLSDLTIFESIRSIPFLNFSKSILHLLQTYVRLCKLRKFWKLVQRAQPEPVQELLRRTVEYRPARRVLPAGYPDKQSVGERLYDTIDIYAADVFYLRLDDRLPV